MLPDGRYLVTEKAGTLRIVGKDSILSGAMVLGLLAYGVSLVLFVLALRNLGTARTGAYFSVAPFVGTSVALLLCEPASARLLIAGALMEIGVWLHVTERHEHVHDEHHRHDHEHGETRAAGEKHTHRHLHEPLRHSHAHFPDAHHRHDHDH